MRKALVSCFVMLFALRGVSVALSPESETDMKIGLAISNIGALLDDHSTAYAEGVANVLTFYHEKFLLNEDQENAYIIEQIVVGLADKLPESEETMDTPNDLLDPQEICEDFSGTWRAEYSECEYIGPEDCQAVDGSYNECASACRHEPEGTICTLQCVEVCTFPDEVVMFEIPDLAKCKIYYDGCNTCTVSPYGELLACTKKACFVQEEPKCLHRKDPSPEELEGCKTWYDGCNTCSVENGALGACTEMACGELSEPKCVTFQTLEY